MFNTLQNSSNTQEQDSADILYGQQNNNNETKRNQLLSELGDSLSPADTLYSSVNDLEKMKKDRQYTPNNKEIESGFNSLSNSANKLKFKTNTTSRKGLLSRSQENSFENSDSTKLAGITNDMKRGGYNFLLKNYDNKIIHQLGDCKSGGDDATGMLDISHKNVDSSYYTKDAIKLDNYKDYRVASDREYLKSKVSQGFNDYNFSIEDINGYFFKSNSEPSKRLADNSYLINLIKENKDTILKGKDISGSFSKDTSSKNFKNAIGKFDLRHGYLDKQGNMHIKIYDTYDFNKGETNPLIQAGRQQMLQGNLTPFFTIHEIVIPKEKLK